MIAPLPAEAVTELDAWTYGGRLVWSTRDPNYWTEKDREDRQMYREDAGHDRERILGR